jgi:hypothetical protein
MGELVDLADRRMWKRVKTAWSMSSHRVTWEQLSEAERLQYRRDFEEAERRLRSRFESR